MSARLCTSQDTPDGSLCGERAKARGLCDPHYKRRKRADSLPETGTRGRPDLGFLGAYMVENLDWLDGIGGIESAPPLLRWLAYTSPTKRFSGTARQRLLELADGIDEAIR